MAKATAKEQETVDEEYTEEAEEPIGEAHADGEDAGGGEVPEGHAPTLKPRATYLNTSDIASLDALFMDDVPESEKAGSGGEARKWHYHNILAAVKQACQANPDRIGQVIELARFATNQGANGIKKRLEDGTTPKPDGTWEFQCGKFTRGDGKGRGSVLYARFMGD